MINYVCIFTILYFAIIIFYHLTFGRASHTDLLYAFVALLFPSVEANTRRWPDVCIMLAHRLLNPYDAEIFLLKPWRLKGFIQFEIPINVLVSSFWFIWIPMLWVYGH